MERRQLTIDEIERRVADDELLIARIRARQMRDLEVLDRAQVAGADGCRNLSEWVSSRLDVGLDTAKALVRTMRRTEQRPDLREALTSGEVTFDRMEALSRIPDPVGLMEAWDVAGVRREAANRTRVSASEEEKTASDRFLVVQPSLDESWWRLWAGLDGYSGALVDKLLTEVADRLPELPDGSRGDSSWRKATALVELCVSDDPPPARVTVFVDAEEAADSNAESGVVLEAGPRVGAEALRAVLCYSVTEVVARSDEGRLMEYGRRSRTVPPALRRAVIYRDGNRCAADGCDSRYRLQAHHIIPWSQGGETTPENLVTLCWYHHQVVVHERGFHVYRHRDHRRIRFHKPRPPPNT